MIAVDDVPEALEKYNDIMSSFPAYLARETGLPIKIEAPPVPEPPPYDEEGANAKLAVLFEQMVQHIVQSNAHDVPSNNTPPNPDTEGWKPLFDWFYTYGHPKLNWTVERLIKEIRKPASTVRHKKEEYDAEHGTSLRLKRTI